jgi:glycosyltransferase involved in cell wall biosynthesis
MKKKIFIEGPFLSESGYGYQSRFALDAILSREDEFDVYIASLRWGQTSWLPADDPRNDKVHEYIEKTNKAISDAQNGKTLPLVFDIHLFIGIPNEVTKKSPINNFLYTAGIETTKVSHQWINTVNGLTGMIMCSTFGKSVFDQTKYSRMDEFKNRISDLETTVPITVVNYGIPDIEPKIPDIKFSTDFNFLTVCQWGPRKNLGTTILGFVDQFHDNPNVGLVVKTLRSNNSYIDRMNTKHEMKNMIKATFPDAKCKVTFIHGNIPDDEMLGLYKHPQIKALINIGHGEGFGLPMFEAAYSGLPVMTTGWSGESDFLYVDKEPKFQKVEYTIGQVQQDAVWEPVILPDAMWAYADIPDYKVKLQDMHDRIEFFEDQAESLKKTLEKTHKIVDKYNQFVDVLLEPYNMQEDQINAWMSQMELIK